MKTISYRYSFRELIRVQPIMVENYLNSLLRLEPTVNSGGDVEASSQKTDKSDR